MPFEISPELEQFIEQEVTCAAIDATRPEEAIDGIKAGLTDIAAGRVQSLDEAFDDLREQFGVAKDA